MQAKPRAGVPRVDASGDAREPQAGIPRTRADRERAKTAAAEYVAQTPLVTPLSAAELRLHSARLAKAAGFDELYADYLSVLINNEAWREAFAAVPYDHRMLLLPKCLRPESRCPASMDELGLLCERCGQCAIPDLQDEAERLGYAVMVAEGSAVVMAMIETHQIEAIIGVSCMNVLELALPHMEAAAIPGFAIALLQSDCRDTTVDLDWVHDAIHLNGSDQSRRLDLDALRGEVERWFARPELDWILGSPSSAADELGRDWLAQGGKRWRPFLTVCAWCAMQADPQTVATDDVRRVAMAVECFHKASLIHDDIEDGDGGRYGEPALHESLGVPLALNVGDLLLGEGYRMLAECHADASIRAAMLTIAAAGHRSLCAGQGDELAWARDPRPLSPDDVLGIFSRKTAPAFEVAVRLGTVLAGEQHGLGDALRRYSEALGIAYQIRDDLDDLEADDNRPHARPTLPMAVAYHWATGDDRKPLDRAWREPGFGGGPDIRSALERLGAVTECHTLLQSYIEQAIRALGELENASLKGLLRRVITRMFRVEVEGWCSEFEARYAPGGEAGAPSAG